jgi:plastocyanin
MGPRKFQSGPCMGALLHRRLAAVLRLAIPLIFVIASFGAPVYAQTVSVSVIDDQFVPKTLTITAGTTVTWTNNGGMTHSVTADDGSYDSGNLSPGQSFSHTYTTPGTYPYYCVFHGAPGGVGMSGTITVTGASAAPTVTSISPTTGLPTGGTTVVINGTNFTGTTAVRFGSTAAASFTVNSANQITAVSPAGTGTVDVTVTNASGTSATGAADRFTYTLPAAPTVTSISPTTGLPQGGTTVVIRGTDFSGATAVSFGSTPAASFTVNSATQITANSPPGTGAVDVTVTTASGTSAAGAADRFTYTLPADSLKLRALQLAVTKLEANASGQATASAIADAIAEGFCDGDQLVTMRPGGLHFNSAGDPNTKSQAKDAVGARANPLSRAAPQVGSACAKDALWVDVQGSGWNTTTSTSDIKGGQVNGLAGVTHQFMPNVLVGLLGGYETFDYSSDMLAGRLKGNGWTVGGYIGWRIVPGLRFDAGLAHSEVQYSGTAGSASASFPGHRDLASAGLTGIYKLQAFSIEPSARIYALWQTEKAYTDSLGTSQGVHEFSTGRVSTGAKITYPWILVDGTTIAPYAGVYLDYYFDNETVADVLQPVDFIQGWSMRATSGLSFSLPSGIILSIGGEVGGLGSGQFTNWTARGGASVPF